MTQTLEDDASLYGSSPPEGGLLQGDTDQIGVDETSKAKGHDYVSLFVDLEKRRTIFVAEGKGSATMTTFVGDFKDHRGNLTVSRMSLSTCPLPLSRE